MYQSIIVDLLSHHQFVLHRLCKDNLTAIGRVRHLHIRKEDAR
jgi:hypothetical protein